MKHKSCLDARVARELGMFSDKKRRMVNLITAEFLRQLCELIAEQGVAGVEGLGRFSVSVNTNRRKATLVRGTEKSGKVLSTRVLDVDRSTRVYFSQCAALKKLLKEKSMETDTENNEEMSKLGVDESSQDLQKLAAKGCPVCGSNELEKHGSVVVCPNCGSAPFEGK
jgi:nucleoid DNA-binding protein/ribosomal protein S27AE